MIGWPNYGELSVCGRLHDIVAAGPNAAGINGMMPARHPSPQ